MNALPRKSVLLSFFVLVGFLVLSISTAGAQSTEPLPTEKALDGSGVETEAATVLEALKSAEPDLRTAIEASIGDFRLAAGDGVGRKTHFRLRAFQVEGNRFVVALLGRPATLDQASWAALTNNVDQVISDSLAAAGLTPPAVEYDITLNGRHPASLSSPTPLAPPADEPATDATMDPQAVATIQGKKIVLSPGHGRYESSGWPYQRSFLFGIVEDEVNLDLVIALDNALAPTGAQRLWVRQLNKNAGNHSASGRPWWQMGAREYIRAQGLPSTVWNQGSTNLNRDIMTRPNYAKYVSAHALVSIHNNAGGGCGTETWYDTINGYTAQSQQLARLIQTKVIQRLRQQWSASWCDRGIKGSAGAYGENRYFTGPAVIVEVGFMDNQSDSNALRNPTFQAIVAAAIKDALVEFYGGTGDPDDNRTLASGQTMNGTISPNSESDTYYFDASQGQRATLRMNKNGSALDSYLIIYAPNGIEVTRNDDSGGNLNSLIDNVLLPQGGRYRVVASSYAGSSGGAYTVSLQISSGVDYTPPPGYSFCAYENQRCSFSDLRDVAYGANGSFAYRYNVSGGIDCYNATFGDPVNGVYKACFTRPVSTVFSGNPSSALNVTQQQVRLDVCADNLPGRVVYATLYRGPVGSYGERLWRHQVTAPGNERCVTFVDMDGAGDTLAGVTYYTVASFNPISDGDAKARRTGCFTATGGRQLCDARSR